MLTIRQLAISLWLLSLSTSFVMSVPMSHSHVLRVVPDELPREKRAVDVPTNAAQNDTKPNISSFTVTSNIKYRYATTTVSNKVANPADVAKEISFTVTLPDAAFISRFLMIIKDKVYEAYVKEKEQAKKDYQQAIDRGETAGHVELSARDSNVFTVSVNVEPQSKVTFNLTYEQLLTRTLGLYENIINVNPGQIVKSMQIQVNIDESSNITVLQVPDLKTSNEIDSVDTKNKLANIEQSGKTAKITWTPTADQQKELSESGVKGQFIVRYDVDRVTNPNQILVDEGYFVHFYAPADLKTLSKHVLFALDISGSMGGRKIEQLREALSQILGDIGEGDYFTLVLFSDSVQLWTLNGTVGEASPSWNYDEIRTTPQPDVGISEKFIIPASKENIAKAKAFASTLNETGGTNIIAAIRKSIQIAQWGQEKEIVKNAKPLIIFLTDGQPNVEMSDTEEIIKTVKKLNVNKYPLFSLAFGQGADYDFLRKLSLSNSGFARNIYVASDTHLQLNNFYKQVASPLLSNVNFEYLPGQIANETLTKATFNNLFNGSELVVAGKLMDSTKPLEGNVTAQSSEGYFCVALPPVIIDHYPNPQNRTKGHLEKLWAYLHIKELLDKDLLSDEKNSTYKQKALQLSLEYSFVTPLTSLVVVKPNETTSAGVHNPQNPESSLRIPQLQTRVSPSFFMNSLPQSASLLPAHASLGSAPVPYSGFISRSGKKSSHRGQMPSFNYNSGQTFSHQGIQQNINYNPGQIFSRGAIQQSPIIHLSAYAPVNYIDDDLDYYSAASYKSASYLSPGVALRGPGSLYASSVPASALGAPGIGVRKTSYLSHRIVPLTISGSNSLDSYDSSGSFQISALPPIPHPAFTIPPIPSTTTSDSLTTVTTTLVSTTMSSGLYSSSFDIVEDDVFNVRVAVSDLPDVKIDSATLLNITDILWLKNVTDIKFPSSNNTYSVGSNDLPNTEFQPCLLPKNNSTIAHCRHLAHCVIPEVISSFQDFVPYGEQCVIDARFVGICCPQKYIHKTESTTTEISSTTTSATTVV